MQKTAQFSTQIIIIAKFYQSVDPPLYMPLNRRITLLIIFILGTALTFWLVSRYSVLDSKAALSGVGAFEDKLTHQAHFHVPDDATLTTRVLYTTLNWYETNWQGMAFGLVLAGAFLTLIGYLPKTGRTSRSKTVLWACSSALRWACASIASRPLPKACTRREAKWKPRWR